MDLTVAVERLPDGRYKASTTELPDLFYIGESDSLVRERMERLVKAVRSPHVRIQSVSTEGGIVLTLAREQEQPSPEETGCSLGSSLMMG
jgi:hypothetical protein